MRYDTLGNSTLLVSSIGFGSMSLGGEEAEDERLVHRAMELGINFFDTADIYDKGVNEEKLGRMLKGRRDQAVIATKVGNRWRVDGSGLDWDPRAEHIIRSVEGSLRRLQTDRIDLYQLHGGTIDDPIDETIGAFETLQQQGKIRYYGISSIRPNVIREYARRSHIVSVMMQYSLLDRRPEEDCLDLLREKGIGVLARGGLAGGLLAGKPAEAYLSYSADDVDRAARAISDLSDARRNPAQTALQFVLQHPAITVAVVGMRTLGQLEEVMGEDGASTGSGEATALSGEEMELLRGVVGVSVYDLHR